ncbi:MAG: TonB-dependent receptor, partial [Pseudomonadota bacterium]
NVFEEVGLNRHQGIEANVFGEISEGFRIYGSFTYLDAEIRRAVDPTLEGNTPEGVPELIAVAGFDVDIAAVAGLGVTGNVRYTDEMFIDNANTTTIPSFTTVDLGVRYGFSIGDVPVLARLSAYNILDNDHFVSGRSRSAVVGSPFAVRGSFTVEFR